jgi:hypothetical protein
MVKVFITDVFSKISAADIIADLLFVYPNHRITFDLDDIDKVLRLEGDDIDSRWVENYVNKKGFTCIEMTS